MSCYGPPGHELRLTLASIRAEEAGRALGAMHAARLCGEPAARSMLLGVAIAACWRGSRAGMVAVAVRRLARPRPAWAPPAVPPVVPARRAA